MQQKIKFGIRMHDMAEGTIEERAAMAQSLGYDCAHIALKKLIKDDKTEAGALTPGFAMHLKRVFEKNHVDIAVLGCYLNLATPDEQELAWNLKQYRAQLRFASMLGCGVVGTETGAPNKEYRYVPECRSEEALQIFLKNLRTVVRYAEQAGVILAIEPVAKHIVYSPEIARRVLDEIDSPNLQIIFDPVNLLDTANFEQREDIFERSLSLLGPDIAMVHLKDFDIVDGVKKESAPCFGMMDYTQILSYLKKEKPYIHVTMEVTKPENAGEALRRLREIYDNIR